MSGAVWQCARGVLVDVDELGRFSSAHECRAELPGVQLPIGTRVPLEVSAEGCGQWMPKEWRMCAPQLIEQGHDVAATTSTFFLNGGFYGQRFRPAAGTVLANGCRQLAFFHFQEWKKAWTGHAGGPLTTGIEPVGEAPRFSARSRNFTINAGGYT